MCNGVYYLFTQLQIDAAMKLKTKIFFGATIVFVHSAVVLQLGAVKIERKTIF